MIDGYVYKQTAINAICQDWCGTSNENCKNPFDPTTDDCFFCDGCGEVELIKALPSTDAVEVVRCEDCKCFDIAKNGVNGFCTKLGIPFDIYDYCSLGEPRENGNLELQ